MTTLSPTSSQTFYQCLMGQLAHGPVVLATVIAADTPAEGTLNNWGRGVGDKQLIWGDAQTTGSLDHVITAELIPPAFEVIKTGLPQQITVPLDDSGSLQIWLARWQGADAIATVQSILSNLSHHRPQRLVIPLISGQTAYMIEAGQFLRNLQGENAYIEEIH